MGSRIRQSQCLGINCGTKSAIVLLVLAAVSLCVSLTFTLTSRLYLKAYYHAAHVAGLTVFFSVFVLAHHLFRLHVSLGCSSSGFNVVQIALNLFHLMGGLVVALGYTALTATTIHVNYDYVGALVFAWVGVIFVSYLVTVTLAAACSDWKSSYDFGLGADKYRVNGDAGGSATSGTASESGACGRGCCMRTWNVLFGIFYCLFHVLFLLVLALSAYHPCAVLDDRALYLHQDDLYSVKVDGHRELSLFLRCRGSGQDTLVYENGLGGMALMQWDFLPKHLQGDYRICVHDRRGFGWSDGFEYDYIGVEAQWAGNSARFFRQLLTEAEITSPIYYMGHSYGGHHIAYFAALYPEMIRGLVFLDSSGFSPVDVLKDLLETVCNFQPLGLLRIAIDTGLFDFESAFAGFVNFEDMEVSTRDEVVSSVLSGSYIASYMREHEKLFETIEVATTAKKSATLQNDRQQVLYPEAKLREILKNKLINCSVLVIDADHRSWSFPGQYFPRFNSTLFQMNVPGSEHSSLVYSDTYSLVVAQLIDLFIQYDRGDVDLATFRSRAGALTA